MDEHGIEPDDSVAQALGIIPHTSKAVLRNAEFLERNGFEITSAYLRAYADRLVTDIRLQTIADAWNAYRQRQSEPWLREEVEAMTDVIGLLDALTKEDT